MRHRSLMGLPMVLIAASCVPPLAARQADRVAANQAPANPEARPGFQLLSLPTALEAPPPPETLAAEIAPGSPARPFDLGRQSVGDYRSAADCLTAAVYYEARSETEDGQRAVAQVVLNRVRHPAFPNSVCGVVYQGSNRSTGCQFSFTCDGSLARGREPGAWDRARRIAEAALAGSVYSPVGLATHYHTTAIRPWWAASLTRAVTIGSHIFYRWRGEWGDPKSFQRPYVGAESFARAGTSGPGAGSDAPAQAPVQTVFGVAVHRSVAANVTLAGVEEGPAVRIHRRSESAAVGRSADAPDEPVHVHRGAEPGAGEALASADPIPSDAAGTPTR